MWLFGLLRAEFDIRGSGFSLNKGEGRAAIGNSDQDWGQRSNAHLPTSSGGYYCNNAVYVKEIRGRHK